MVPKLKNLEIRNTIKKFQANTSNNTPEGYNMTPNVSEEDAKKVRDKYDATYMKGDGEIKTWNDGKKVITGSSGLLGVIGGGALKLVGSGLKGLWDAGKILAGNPGGAVNATKIGLRNSKIYGEGITKSNKLLETYRKELQKQLKTFTNAPKQYLKK